MAYALTSWDWQPKLCHLSRHKCLLLSVPQAAKILGISQCTHPKLDSAQENRACQSRGSCDVSSRHPPGIYCVQHSSGPGAEPCVSSSVPEVPTAILTSILAVRRTSARPISRMCGRTLDYAAAYRLKLIKQASWNYRGGRAAGTDVPGVSGAVRCLDRRPACRKAGDHQVLQKQLPEASGI